MSHRKIINSAEDSTRQMKETYLSIHERQLDREREVNELNAALAKRLAGFAAFQLGQNAEYFEEASVALLRRDEGIQNQKKKLFDVEREIKKASEKAQALDSEFDRIAALVEEKALSNVAVNEWRAALSRLEELVAWHHEIESEVNEKLKAFHANEYFTYLLKAGYGTQEWDAKRLQAAAQRLAARVCDFKTNKPTYDMLNALLRASQQRVSEAGEKVEQRKVNVGDYIENTKRVAGYYPAQEAAEFAASEVSGLKAKAASILKELKEAANDEDSAYKRALKLVEEMVSKMSDSALDLLVRNTEASEDDSILNDIRKIRRRILEIREAIKQDTPVERESKEQYQRAKDAEEIIRRRVKKSSDYSYREIDVEALVTGYALGSLSSSDIGRQVGRAETYTPSPSYSRSSSSSDWSSSSSSDSSSFGGGGFSSSSSFGGGSSDFSTSDSF